MNGAIKGVCNARLRRKFLRLRSSSSFRMVELSALGEIETSIRSSGIGTLQFGHAVPVFYRRGADWLSPLERNGAPAFVDIADAEMVYRIILEAEAKEKLDAGQSTAPVFGFSRRS